MGLVSRVAFLINKMQQNILSYYYYCRFTALVREQLGGLVPEETFTHSHRKSSISVAGGLSSFWILRGAGKIIEASALTIWLDATPPRPSMPPPPSSPSFTPDALPAATLPIYAELHTWRLCILSCTILFTCVKQPV